MTVTVLSRRHIVWTNSLRALRKERMELRMAIMPFLQAESDFEAVEAREKFIAWEKQVMKNVPGWVAGENVYRTKSYMPSAIATMPKGPY
mmetsp:Transcript_595/g.1189  ORF Transcript_595/g.1189 Transcript_595/m.1189 type:complete len:90 (-) Transcript_595:85-354(-)